MVLRQKKKCLLYLMVLLQNEFVKTIRLVHRSLLVDLQQTSLLFSRISSNVIPCISIELELYFSDKSALIFLVKWIHFLLMCCIFLLCSQLLFSLAVSRARIFSFSLCWFCLVVDIFMFTFFTALILCVRTHIFSWKGRLLQARPSQSIFSSLSLFFT